MYITPNLLHMIMQIKPCLLLNIHHPSWIFITTSLQAILTIGANKYQHQESYQRDTIPDKFIIFFKIGKAKKVNSVSKMQVCM